MRRHILFLNRHAAARGSLQQYKFDAAYIAACRWFHCGLIDRTKTLRPGFPYKVLDVIPRPHRVGSFAEIADSTGEDLIRESLRKGRPLQVLWSGGIDSTAALVALSKAAFNRTLRRRIQVLCSQHSINEYPRFFSEHIAGRFTCSVTAAAIGESLDDTKLIVTGEHGDQLFGSVKLQSIVEKGEAHRPYRSYLLRLISEEVASPKVAKSVLSLLQPQVDAAPVNITTVYDYLWWVNFSLKWQHVSLRIAVFRGTRLLQTYLALRHFFRNRAFQRWSLTHPAQRSCRAWSAYKKPAKSYILDYTGDRDYFDSKTKEPSLRNVLVDPRNRRGLRVRVSWCWGQRPRFVYYTPASERIPEA